MARSVLPSVFAVLVLVACGSTEASRTGGPHVNDQTPSETRITCSASYAVCPSAIAAGGTALSSLESARPLAEASEKNAVWSGYFSGRALDRTGHPTAVADSGWNFEFCSGDTGNVVDFYITKTGCSAADVCGKNYPCAAEAQLPKLDADQAIAAAFPDDPASTLYVLGYAPKYGRRWLVARKDDTQAVVQVDADTGAVVP